MKNRYESLSESRGLVLREIIKERYENSALNNNFIKSETDYYENSVEDFLVTKANPQEDMTDADKINGETEGIEIDIRTLFRKMNATSESIKNQQRIMESMINEVDVSINNANRKIVEAGNDIRNIGARSTLFDDFTDYRYQEKDEQMYLDKEGEILPAGRRLEVNTDDDTLRLPIIYSENTLVNFSGVKAARLSLEDQSGASLIKHKNPETGVEKAIDTSLETFWSESIFVDEPFKINFGTENYSKGFGAFVKLCIKYDIATEINEIMLMPYASYPIEVRAIIVYDNDNRENPYELASPTAINKNIEGKDTISYRFQKLIAKEVCIIINQQHYVKRELYVNVNDKTLVDAWLERQGAVKTPEEYQHKPLYKDMSIRNPYWEQVQKYLRRKDIDMELSGYSDYDSENNIQVVKYEYQYGLYNISINNNEYLDHGVYITSPLTNLNVQKVEIDTVEDHSMIENIESEMTCIEYYATEKDNPSYEDWLSILPRNTKRISGELLELKERDGVYLGVTRFAPKNIISVMEDGIPLQHREDFEVIGRDVMISNQRTGSLYTIDYIPTESAYSIDFVERMKRRQFNTEHNRMEEYIDGQKHNERISIDLSSNIVSLKYCPFWDRGRISLMEQDILFNLKNDVLQIGNWNATYLNNEYIPMEIQVILPTGETISQQTDESDIEGAKVINKTDYHDLNKNLLSPFDGNNYEYRVERNEVVFNTELPKGTRIVVSYYYLTGPIRIKIVMRRNNIDEKGLTPVLHEYTVGLHSLI